MSHITSDEGNNGRRDNQDVYSGYMDNYESIGRRNSYSGNRDGYPYRDDNRDSDRYDYRTASDINADNRDNDRYN